MKRVSRMGSTQFALAIAVTALVAGCANAPLRTEASTSRISAAKEAGADKVPRAAFHLQLAKEELAAARALSDNGDKEKAASMLLRAEADAELAVALSHQDAERSEAIAAIERVRQLRKENQ